jgi:spore germination protein (amino acid permease)
VRQAMIMYIVACMSPVTRLFPAAGAKYAAQAGWVSVIVAAAPVFVLVLVFSALFKKGDAGPANLSDVFELAYGKILARAVLAFYLVWIALLYILYIRYYAERMLSTIFTTTDIRFFIVTMMALVLIATRGRLEAFARFSELSIIVLTLILAGLVVCLIPTFKLRYVWPVTYVDAVPVAKGSFQMIGILCYFSLFFFLGDHISRKEEIKKRGRGAVLFLGILSTVITLACIGTLSFRVSQRMPVPFFSTTKLITTMQPLDRMEAFLISAWVISDFIIITVFAFILMNIIKKLTGAREARDFATPVSFFGVVGGIYLVTNRFELEAFSNSNFLNTMNIVTGFAIPVVTLIVGKLRGKI